MIGFEAIVNHVLFTRSTRDRSQDKLAHHKAAFDSFPAPGLEIHEGAWQRVEKCVGCRSLMYTARSVLPLLSALTARQTNQGKPCLGQGTLRGGDGGGVVRQGLDGWWQGVHGWPTIDPPVSTTLSHMVHTTITPNPLYPHTCHGTPGFNQRSSFWPKTAAHLPPQFVGNQAQTPKPW